MTHKRPRRDVHLYRGLTKAITPAVLLAGLLLLSVYHFHGVLKTATAEEDLFQGVTAYSIGNMELDFQRDAGVDRPAILFDRMGFLTYSEWESIISVDGHVEELWNNFHGYSVDSAHHAIYTTISGYGWQVTEIATLVNDHSATVTFEFTARNIGIGVPHHVELLIVHRHNNGEASSMSGLWFYPQVHGTTFSAEELPLAVQNPQVPYLPNTSQSFNPVATTTLTIDGSAVAQTPITLNDFTSEIVQGHSQSWASSFSTRFDIDNPPVDQLVPLGTETITIQPMMQGAGTPVILPLSGTLGG